VGEFTFVTWDGGGNVAVAAAIAAALRARGHDVAVAGPLSLQRTIDSLQLSYAELGIVPPSDPSRRLGYLLDVIEGTDSMADDLRRLADQTEVLVVDCNLSWALQSRIAPRTAVLVHTALGLYLPVWQAVLDVANDGRRGRGLPPFATAADSWAWPDLLLVSSLSHFDRPLPPGRLRPVYVGPVGAEPPHEPEVAPIPSSPHHAQVLVSYTTDRLQNIPGRLQTALDALAGLPITVLATTGGVVETNRLRVPANATVTDYFPHDAVINNVKLVVCHAGHGTTMSALTHGVPLVCVPGQGRDQEPIAIRVSELGLGIALQEDATASMIQDAVATILADHSYQDRARTFAHRSGPPNGAERAANELLALLTEPPPT
jgi:UDP:flavonoid glycosyltransferase YjiC (YdhE family)